MEQNFTKLKVLLVEDQPESRALLKGMLEEIGITHIFEAQDGRTGLQLIDGSFDDFVDVILCDWNMPTMTGIDFLRQVRSTGNDIPFMMITGRGDQASVIEARNVGVDGYIKKPYSAAQIETKMRILVHRMKAA